MSARYLARSADGKALLRNENGYVPLAAADPSLSSVEDALRVVPDEPASFFKPASALTGPAGPIRLPPAELTDRVTAEAELAVVIGRTCTDVPESCVEEVVAGYVPVLDVTAEDVLERNPRFLTRAKSFDTFLVLGPAVVVPTERDDSALDRLEDCTVERSSITRSVSPTNSSDSGNSSSRRGFWARCSKSSSDSISHTTPADTSRSRWSDHCAT